MLKVTGIERAKIILDEARRDPSSRPEYQINALLEAVAFVFIANVEQSKRVADTLQAIEKQLSNIATRVR